MFKLYDDFAEVCEPFLRKTSTGEAPWLVVLRRRCALPQPDGRAPRCWRRCASGWKTSRPRVCRTGLRRRQLPAIDKLNVLRALRSRSDTVEKGLRETTEEWQGRLNLAVPRSALQEQLSVVAVFEGNDAAGKGGAIRRITGALDARGYQTISVAAPTEEERAQPYLWRFWRHLPRRGRFTIFDRSWYGRVLVERVEGFCGEVDWMRAYSEINDFEAATVAPIGLVV